MTSTAACPRVAAPKTGLTLKAGTQGPTKFLCFPELLVRDKTIEIQWCYSRSRVKYSQSVRYKQQNIGESWPKRT